MSVSSTAPRTLEHVRSLHLILKLPQVSELRLPGYTARQRIIYAHHLNTLRVIRSGLGVSGRSRSLSDPSWALRKTATGNFDIFIAVDPAVIVRITRPEKCGRRKGKCIQPTWSFGQNGRPRAESCAPNYIEDVPQLGLFNSKIPWGLPQSTSQVQWLD